ncbi:YbjN domain-containing protein [Parvularcula lutaonensis]|uniref:YbjN domain-containing protein n=1 Tax=Parvularcula lutaonensis TaxID=491923 RepID=A0ABV7MB87_9PROT|nr:YbjN domain-containing protein [Parvularcula lutaonensis]GGY39968.1 hypothetical protein GCM10007148_05510 [Parvularcula lutaonensis]
MITRSITAIAALGLSGLSSAHAQQVLAERPETVVRYLQNAGYRALLETDDEGYNVIRTGIGGWNYDIYFLDCDKEDVCHSLKFQIGFDLPEGTSLEATNAYNFNRPLGSASIDKNGDPWLEWVVSTRGGLTKRNFDDVIDWWATAVRWFEEDFPFPDDSDKPGDD